MVPTVPSRVKKKKKTSEFENKSFYQVVSNLANSGFGGTKVMGRGELGRDKYIYIFDIKITTHVCHDDECL